MTRSDESIGSLAEGRYHLEKIIGQGGMAVVYSAWDTRLRVRRAVKILSPKLASNAMIRERFEREARVMARLEHPHIVTVHDVGADGNKPYIIMELLQGGCLADLIQANVGMEPSAALEYAHQVLDALRFAHDEGVIHRDIKPENVLLDRNKKAKVADFGIARLEETDHALTRTGAVLGTWAYMAPELRTNGKTSAPASDIYAVGAMIFACVTGRPPFDLYASNLQGQHFDGLPAPLYGVIQKATCYHPRDRFSTAQEMAAQVDAAMRALDAAGVSSLPSGSTGQLSSLGGVAIHDVVVPPSTDTFAFLDEREPEPPAPTIAPLDAEPPLAQGTLAPIEDEPAAQGLEQPRSDVGEREPAVLVAGTLSEGTVASDPAAPSRRRWLLLLGAALIASVPVVLWRSSQERAIPVGEPAERAEIPTLGPVSTQPEPSVDIEPAPTVPPETTKEAAPPNTETPVSAPGWSTRTPVVDEPSPVAPTVIEPQPFPAPEIVSFSLLSDPLGGVVRVAGQQTTTPGKLELNEGRYHFEFEHGDWSTSCDEQIATGVARLKFTQGKQGCMLIY